MKLTMREISALRELVQNELRETDELLAEMAADKETNASYILIQEDHAQVLQGVLEKLEQEWFR